jgi:hypothetical protein
MRRVGLAVAGSMVPSAASACTWCVSSAFGDRTFSWPYLILIAVPFVVGSAIAGILAVHHWRRQPSSAGGIAPASSRVALRPALPLDKETT